MDSAYVTLLKFYSNTPSDLMKDSLFSYGFQLGKSRDSIKAELATDFSLRNYLDGKMIKLSDYKGKMELLTYWFPACGPCRAEFPHFESVLAKFKRDEIVYLAINLLKDQDGYVLPFLKSTKHSFIPLKDDVNWDKKNLSAYGAPTNYLIDKEGRIVWSDFQIGSGNQRSLEIMLEELLESK